ncbi:MAG: hypothetical protein LBP59_03920 [Planctomycetaceae bacterium]|nr:hypothetical protein [Planctomycetaceae bacterium]
MLSLTGQVRQIFIVTINLFPTSYPLKLGASIQIVLEFQRFKASKPAVRKLGRRR